MQHSLDSVAWLFVARLSRRAGHTYEFTVSGDTSVPRCHILSNTFRVESLPWKVRAYRRCDAHGLLGHACLLLQGASERTRLRASS